MPKKLQQIKSRRETTPPKDSSPEFIGSLRSQRNVVTEWKLKRDLKTCNSQIGYWERKLTTAQEGVTRWTAQISAGQTGSYSILQGFVKEVGEAKDMITGFKEQAAISEAQIDALLPDAAKAAERAESQRVLAGQVRARLEIDRKFDFILETLRGTLSERAALTRKMREGARSLEFDYDLNLDEERFEALFRMLPRDMAAESEKFCSWFLGEERDRKPCKIRSDNIVLEETLRANNAFSYDDCPLLTKEEAEAVERISAGRGPFAPPVEEAPKRLGEPAPEIPASQIQWAMMRP